MTSLYQFASIIPVFRIFDITKAKDFYIDYLGFTVSWEYPADNTMPIYMEIKRGNLIFHLTEHHGDGSPGAHVRVNMTGLKAFHEELAAKDYKYMKPGMEETFYQMNEVAVIDPFGSKIIFSEPVKQESPESKSDQI